MKVLATHPGRYGDLLWALPTVRALAQTFSCQVDLLLSPRYSDPYFCALLKRQIYIGTVTHMRDWAILETAPISPRIPPNLPPGYDRIFHLGYTDWPAHALPLETYQLTSRHALLAPLNLAQPWIVAQAPMRLCKVVVGFSDEYFEMKYGLARLLWEHLGEAMVNLSGGPRWTTPETRIERNWEAAANWIAGAELFVGCCSALHVLACALGTPVILVEPQVARHHDAFYPYGKLGPEVLLLTGNDGLPTFDSRHLLDAVDARIPHTREEAMP
jgi:hypothetical protein